MVHLVHLELDGKFRTYQHIFSKISDVGLSHLSSLLNLTYLSLKYNKISDTGLSNLSCLVNLTFLDIGRESEISNYGLSFLFPLVNLVNLKLGVRIISNEALNSLLSKLCKLNMDSIEFSKRSFD
jgi:Leucine-rich repeat (LRR) protein